MSHVGILGGSFNPPHRAHIALARHARDELSLDRVVLIPARAQPQKPAEPDPGPRHRLEMCRLAAAGEPRVDVCAMEIDRDGPSYTVDTLRAIHTGHPDLTLTFILGADSARTIPTWREPESLLRLADLAVAARGGEGRAAVMDALATLDACDGDAASRVRFLEMAPLAISSSDVRDRAMRGEPIDELVGEGVAGDIRDQGLYVHGTVAGR